MDPILRFAREDPTWGYVRIQGAPANVGYHIADSTRDRREGDLARVHAPDASDNAAIEANAGKTLSDANAASYLRGVVDWLYWQHWHHRLILAMAGLASPIRGEQKAPS